MSVKDRDSQLEALREETADLMGADWTEPNDCFHHIVNALEIIEDILRNHTFS